MKFGGWVFLLPFAYRRAMEPSARLLRVWLAVGLALGGAVVFTPLLFRFEYFVMPAVAWAAALGASELGQPGKGWVVTGLRVFSCAVQVALVLGLATARFELTHRHYDSVLGIHGRHMEDIDQRHVELQGELVRHVHDLVRRIDIVLAEGEKNRVALEAALRDVRARLSDLETRAGDRPTR